MKIQFDIPDYNEERGFVFSWEDNFNITVKVKNDSVHVIANKDGLLSLAKHLVTLAQDDFPSGYHIHLDDLNSLEEGSNELIIIKE